MNQTPSQQVNIPSLKNLEKSLNEKFSPDPNRYYRLSNKKQRQYINEVMQCVDQSNQAALRWQKKMSLKKKSSETYIKQIHARNDPLQAALSQLVTKPFKFEQIKECIYNATNTYCSEMGNQKDMQAFNERIKQNNALVSNKMLTMLKELQNDIGGIRKTDNSKKYELLNKEEKTAFNSRVDQWESIKQEETLNQILQLTELMTKWTESIAIKLQEMKKIKDKGKSQSPAFNQKYETLSQAYKLIKTLEEVKKYIIVKQKIIREGLAKTGQNGLIQFLDKGIELISGYEKTHQTKTDIISTIQIRQNAAFNLLDEMQFKLDCVGDRLKAIKPLFYDKLFENKNNHNTIRGLFQDGGYFDQVKQELKTFTAFADYLVVQKKQNQQTSDASISDRSNLARLNSNIDNLCQKLSDHAEKLNTWFAQLENSMAVLFDEDLPENPWFLNRESTSLKEQKTAINALLQDVNNYKKAITEVTKNYEQLNSFTNNDNKRSALINLSTFGQNNEPQIAAPSAKVNISDNIGEEEKEIIKESKEVKKYINEIIEKYQIKAKDEIDTHITNALPVCHSYSKSDENNKVICDQLDFHLKELKEYCYRKALELIKTSECHAFEEFKKMVEQEEMGEKYIKPAIDDAIKFLITRLDKKEFFNDFRFESISALIARVTNQANEKNTILAFFKSSMDKELKKLEKAVLDADKKAHRELNRKVNANENEPFKNHQKKKDAIEAYHKLITPFIENEQNEIVLDEDVPDKNKHPKPNNPIIENENEEIKLKLNDQQIFKNLLNNSDVKKFVNLLRIILQKINTEKINDELKKKFGDEALLEEIQSLKNIQKGITDNIQENLKEKSFQELPINVFTEDEIPEALKMLNAEFNHLLQINFENLQKEQEEELVDFNSKWKAFNPDANNNLPDQESDITLILAKPDNQDDPNDDMNLDELKERLNFYTEATDKYNMTLDELKRWLELYKGAMNKRFSLDAISSFPKEEQDYLDQLEQVLDNLTLQLKNYNANENILPDSFKSVIKSVKKDIKHIEITEKAIKRSQVPINADTRSKLNLAFELAYAELLSLSPKIEIERFSTTEESTWKEIEEKFKEYDEIYQSFKNKNSETDALGFFEKRNRKERINNINNSLTILTEEIEHSKTLDPNIRKKLNLVLQSAYEKLVTLGQEKNVKLLILDKSSTLKDVREIFTNYNRAYEKIEKKPLEILVFDFIKENKIKVSRCHSLIQKIKEQADINSTFKNHENLKNTKSQLQKDQKFYEEMTKVLSDNLKLNDKVDNEKIDNHDQAKEANENEINSSSFVFMMYSFYTSITLFGDLKDKKSSQSSNSHQDASNDNSSPPIDDKSSNESFKNIKTESYSVRMIFLAISLQLNYHFGLDAQLKNQNIQKSQLEKINNNIQNNPKCKELNNILGLSDAKWIMFRMKTFVTVLTVHINNSKFTSKDRDDFLKTFNENLFNENHHSNDFLGKEINVFDKAITVFKKRISVKNYSIVKENIKTILVGSLESFIKETNDNSAFKNTRNSFVNSYKSNVDSPPFLSNLFSEIEKIKKILSEPVLNMDLLENKLQNNILDVDLLEDESQENLPWGKYYKFFKELLEEDSDPKKTIQNKKVVKTPTSKKEKIKRDLQIQAQSILKELKNLEESGCFCTNEERNQYTQHINKLIKQSMGSSLIRYSYIYKYFSPEIQSAISKARQSLVDLDIIYNGEGLNKYKKIFTEAIDKNKNDDKDEILQDATKEKFLKLLGENIYNSLSLSAKEVENFIEANKNPQDIKKSLFELSNEHAWRTDQARMIYESCLLENKVVTIDHVDKFVETLKSYIIKGICYNKQMHEEIKVHRIETQRIALNEPLNQIRKKNEKFIKTIDTFNNEAGAITLDDERNEMKLKEIAVNDEIVLQSNRSFLSFFSCQNLNNKRNIGIVGVVFALGGIICMIAGYNHDNSYYKMAGLCLITMAIGMAILYCLTKNKKNSSPVAISEEQNVQNAEVDDRQNQSNIVLQ